jgi:osmotically inducible lipoprotein OsmB
MNKFNIINTMQKYTLSAVAAAMLLGLGACSGMSTQDKNTAFGAGVGPAGGITREGSGGGSR